MASIGPNTFSFGLSALQLIIELLGNRRTGKTGPQKMEMAVDHVTPIFDAAVQASAGNTKNPVSRAEILAAGQAIHDTLSQIGAVQPTSILEAHPGVESLSGAASAPVSATVGDPHTSESKP